MNIQISTTEFAYYYNKNVQSGYNDISFNFFED